jgi:hypothetical protein
MKILPSSVAYAAVVLSLPIAGCAGRTSKPSAPPPQSVAEQPATPQTAAKPLEPTPVTVPTPAPSGTTPAPSGTTPAPTGTTPAPSGTTPAPSGTTPAPKSPSTTAPPVKKTPAPSVPAPKPVAPPVASPAAPAAPAPLDLTALKEHLKATKAIGVFTKISLKNQVDDLMSKFSDYYQGKAKTTMPELRRSYDLLIMKVLSLLQDSDKQLAAEVVSSREAIWALLSDRKKFATLQG